MFLPDQFSFFSPVKTCCGKRALEMMPNEISAMGATRAMVLCSRLARERGWDRLLQQGFQGAGIPLGFCHDIPEAADTVTIQTLRDLYRDQDCDAIIGLGGSGVMDAAKAVNLLVSERADDLFRFIGQGTISRPLKPLVAVLSAEGNGYETTGFASPAGQRLFSPYLAPQLAVIDDRITVFDDPVPFLAMILFALAGAVDAFIGEKKNPFTDTYAGGCIRLIVETLAGGRLPGPKDRNGRNALVGAVNMGAAALSNNGRGRLHRLGEMLASTTAVPAGILMGQLLPTALRIEMEGENPHLGDLLLPTAWMDTYAATPAENRSRVVVTRFTEWMDELFAENARHLPTSLAEAGISGNALALIGDDATKAARTPTEVKEDMAVLTIACGASPEAAG